MTQVTQGFVLLKPPVSASADPRLLLQPVWQVENIVQIVQTMLKHDRVKECTKATRLLVIACAHALSEGTLTYQGKQVKEVFTMIGNVGNTRKYNGGATEPGHWWLRLAVESDHQPQTATGATSDVEIEQRDIDLTACQFYTELGAFCTQDPCGAPLQVSLSGSEHGSHQQCGQHPQPPEEYKSIPEILASFRKPPKGEADNTKERFKRKLLVKDMEIMFLKLNMCTQTSARIYLLSCFLQSSSSSVLSYLCPDSPEASCGQVLHPTLQCLK